MDHDTYSRCLILASKIYGTLFYNNVNYDKMCDLWYEYSGNRTPTWDRGFLEWLQFKSEQKQRLYALPWKSTLSPFEWYG